MEDDVYKPIDCNYYDLLLDRSTKKAIVHLEYVCENKNLCTADQIVDVYTKEKAEYLKTLKGLVIRLDHIVQVDNIYRPGESVCRIS